MKYVKKTLSVFLSLLTILSMCSVSMPVFAAYDWKKDLQQIDDSYVQEDFSSKIVAEVEALREENTKHFLCEDGSYIATTYSEPVHYKENGEWKEIDNTLKLSNKVKSSSGKAMYVPKSTDAEVKIPQSFSDGQKISLTKKGHTISFGVSQDKSVKLSRTATVVNNLEELSSNVQPDKTELRSKTLITSTDSENYGEITKYNNEVVAIENQAGAIVYENVFESADLEYVVTTNSIKENIVVYEKQNDYTYKFDMDFGDLVPIVNEDNSIRVVDPETEETVFFVGAPYMYDANDIESTDVDMSLVEDAGIYLLTLKASSDWINASERTFPVVIDPIVYFSIDDVFVMDGLINKNVTKVNKELRVGRNLTNLTRTYIKPTMPSNIPKGSYVNHAGLYLYRDSYYRAPSGEHISIDAYDCYNVADWNTDTITWNNQPFNNSENGYKNNGAVRIDSEYVGDTKYDYWFDIDGLALRWINLGINKGVMLASSDESTKTQMDFYSSRATDASFRPEVYISYVEPSVDVSNWETDSQAKESSAFTITTSSNWTVSSDASWISLSATSGCGIGSSKIIVEENTSVKDRTGTVVVKIGNTVVGTITVTQFGADNVAPSMPYLYAESGLIYILSTSFDFNEETDSPETLEYKIGNNDWTKYTEPFEVVNTTDVIIYARTVDKAGNTSPVNLITLSSTIGEYDILFDDIEFGQGVLPVEFGRAYSNNRGWFFSFNANVTSLGTNGYVFTDFYGYKHYYFKNVENKYVNLDEEELAINANGYAYSLSYCELTLNFSENGKLASIEKDNVITKYIWNNNILTIGDIATVEFNENLQPTNITITKSKNGQNYTKTVYYGYKDGNLTSFVDAVGQVHTYEYSNNKMINNDGLSILYVDNRVQKITHPNNSYIKYEYEDNAQNPAFNDNVNVGRVKVSDSKGITDYFYYCDGFMVQNSLNSYGDSAIYNPSNISNETYVNNISDIAYVVEYKPEETVDYTNIDESTGMTSPSLQTDDEYPLFEIDELGDYTFFQYDEKHRIVKQLNVNNESNVVNNNTTFEEAESVAKSKTEYVYDDYDNIVSKNIYQRIFNELRLTYCESNIYNNNIIVHIEKNNIKYNQSGTEVLGEITEKTVDYEYDVWGQCICITENANMIDETKTKYTYDNIGREIKTEKNGQIIKYVYSGKKLKSISIDEEITEYSYLNDGSLYYIEKPNGENIFYEYDNYGNLLFQTYNRSYSIQYNTLGSVVAMYSRFDETTVDRLQRVRYTYSSDIAQNITNSLFNNGDNINYSYDDEGRKTGIKLNNVLKYEFAYSNDNAEKSTTVNDYINNTYKVVTDNNIELYDVNNSLLFSVHNDTNSETSDSIKSVLINNSGYSYCIISNEEADTFKSTIDSQCVDFTKKYSYNDFENSNLATASINDVLSTSYSYNLNGAVSGIQNTLIDETQNYMYTYDNTGKIANTSIIIQTQGELVETSDNIHYTYDNGYLTVVENETTKWVYTYDSRGNITEKKEYAIVDNNGIKEYNLKQGGIGSYTYRTDWTDELDSYNGQTFSYDGSGNPINYRGHTLTWEFGRQLSSFDDITYTYDENGVRRSKSSNGKKTIYYTDSNNNVIYQSDGTTSITFYYDKNNNVIGFKHGNNIYYYVKNLQNDVVAITDNNGSVIVRYTYDPWGKIISVEGNNTIGILNPFRYRSYYYDSDIQMYYLQSRYYDPEICRFINCDNINYIGRRFEAIAYNPFAYCNNDPVNYSDPNGESALAAAAATLGVSTSTLVVAAVMVVIIADLATGGQVVLSLSEAIVLIIESAVTNVSSAISYSQAQAVATDMEFLVAASTAPTPLPPNKGGKGTRTDSKKLYNKDGNRIDVENPGNREGQIHLQQKGVKDKYYYNVKDMKFHIGRSNGPLAPNSVQKLLDDPKVIKAIAKGLKILGY